MSVVFVFNVGQDWTVGHRCLGITAGLIGETTYKNEGKVLP